MCIISDCCPSCHCFSQWPRSFYLFQPILMNLWPDSKSDSQFESMEKTRLLFQFTRAVARASSRTVSGEKVYSARLYTAFPDRELDTINQKSALHCSCNNHWILSPEAYHTWIYRAIRCGEYRDRNDGQCNIHRYVRCYRCVA